MNRHNLWRRHLDPRDPDYDEPEAEVEDDREPQDPPEYADDDPRGDGPYHYVPPGDH